MENISVQPAISKRDVFYYRQRMRNRVFAEVASFFAEVAARNHVTKREVARRLACDPAQITRWLSSPSNMTLDTISDLLLALQAEADVTVVPFDERMTPNFVHPLMASVLLSTAFAPSPDIVAPPLIKSTTHPSPAIDANSARGSEFERGGATATNFTATPATLITFPTTGGTTWPTAPQHSQPLNKSAGSGTPNIVKSIPIPA